MGAMPQVLIESLDEGVFDVLQRRASETGAAIEEEGRRTLEAAVRLDALKRLDAIRAQIPTSPGESSLEILRRDRARDDPPTRR